MSKLNALACVCLLMSAASCHRPPAIGAWEISYRRVEYFFGNTIIKIGTDSCYYESAAGIHKNPPIIRWNSSGKNLNALYKEIEKFNLHNCSPITAWVTETPFETIELIQNNRVRYSLQKDQQSVAGAKKFDSVLSCMKSFISGEQGWKY